jgi:hypothetical protein
MPRQQISYKGDAADIFQPVFPAEPQALGEMRPDGVAVQNFGGVALRGQAPKNCLRQCAFSRAAESGEPDQSALFETSRPVHSIVRDSHDVFTLKSNS